MIVASSPYDGGRRGFGNQRWRTHFKLRAGILPGSPVSLLSAGCPPHSLWAWGVPYLLCHFILQTTLWSQLHSIWNTARPLVASLRSDQGYTAEACLEPCPPQDTLVLRELPHISPVHSIDLCEKQSCCFNALSPSLGSLGKVCGQACFCAGHSLCSPTLSQQESFLQTLVI